MVSGDGIYSRYLTQYHGAGRYSFDISVHDNHHQAFTIRPAFLNRQQSNDGKTFGGRSKKSIIGSAGSDCCGSTITISTEDQIPTGAFNRKTLGPVLHLLSVPPSDVDMLPPAQVKDLKIQVLPKSGQLMASWTAPGSYFIAIPIKKQ